MKMTEKQMAVLAGLTCQRLSADEKNLKLIRNIRNVRGAGLISYLRDCGWEEDQDGTTAFYLIKNQKDEILMFFSLKCGALFDPLNQHELEERIDLYREILSLINGSRSAEDRAAGMKLLEKIRSNQDISMEQLERSLIYGLKQKKHTLHEILGDQAHEPNEMIVRVGETHPGIELVHFCINEKARDFWKQSGMGRPMGEVLFWWFIAPIMYEVQKTVGCQYVFLFAADLSPYRSLINYYQDALKFEQPSDIGTSKPRYDFQCEFMCQKTNGLREHRAHFIENFNPDPMEFV